MKREKPKKPQCEVIVYSPHSFSGVRCSNNASTKDERGRNVCGIHSPEAEARRKAKFEEKYQEKRELDRAKNAQRIEMRMIADMVLDCQERKCEHCRLIYETAHEYAEKNA